MLCAAVVALALAPVHAGAAPATRQLYVSLGDSYASGYQPTGVGQGGNTRNGFAYQVPSVAAPRGYRLELVNFGCAGATTSSLLEAKGCAPQALGPGGRAYPNRTQLAAASRFLRRNRKRTALATVSIGGNNVTACVSSPDPVACVAAAVVEIREDVTRIARRLRRGRDRRYESSEPPIPM